MYKLLRTVSLGFLFTLLSLTAYPKTIMVVLGSADSLVLQSRIEVAHHFYKTRPVDKIIVTGGCGAHGSSICEASQMFEGLVKRGVEASKIYKEENAKTTVQNYVFSRVLCDENGQRIIQKGDTVYVISDHWHAISVAARFQKYDNVIGRFFIEGAIAPKETDKLDYVSILNGQQDQDKFLTKAKWLTPDAAWSDSEHYFYLMDSTVYTVDASNTVLHSAHAATVFSGLAFSDTIKNSFIDIGKEWLVRQGDKVYVLDKYTRKVKESKAWKDLIKNLPTSWEKAVFNAGMLVKNNLILFANEKILVAEKIGKTFSFVSETEGSKLIAQWPYSWGKSNVSGTYYDLKNKEFLLFRNLEVLKVSADLKALRSAEKLKVTLKD